jgi:Cu-Zn family superoxide dismutase
VRIALRVQGLAPGPHALHVHASARCEGPDFESAGHHLNPAGRQHGLRNPEGPHLGDLPDLQVGPDGKGEARVLVKGADLGDGPWSFFGPDGTSLVVHEGADDGVTDPGGGAGRRIACGVVTHGRG